MSYPANPPYPYPTRDEIKRLLQTELVLFDTLKNADRSERAGALAAYGDHLEAAAAFMAERVEALHTGAVNWYGADGAALRKRANEIRAMEAAQRAADIEANRNAVLPLVHAIHADWLEWKSSYRFGDTEDAPPRFSVKYLSEQLADEIAEGDASYYTEAHDLDLIGDSDAEHIRRVWFGREWPIQRILEAAEAVSASPEIEGDM